MVCGDSQKQNIFTVEAASSNGRAMAQTINVASKGPTKKNCTIQRPFTKWQYSLLNIIHRDDRTASFEVTQSFGSLNYPAACQPINMFTLSTLIDEPSASSKHIACLGTTLYITYTNFLSLCSDVMLHKANRRTKSNLCI